MSIPLSEGREGRERELLENEFNHYATSKSVSQNMLNTAAFQAQVLILVNTLHSELSGYEVALVVLVALSMALQVIVFILLVLLAKSKNISGTIGQYSVNGTNSLVTALTGVLLLITSSISVLYVPSRNVTL